MRTSVFHPKLCKPLRLEAEFHCFLGRQIQEIAGIDLHNGHEMSHERCKSTCRLLRCFPLSALEPSLAQIDPIKCGT